MRGMVVGSGFFKYRKAALYENDDQKKFKTMTVKYVGIAGLKKELAAFEKKYGMSTEAFVKKVYRGELDECNDFIDWLGLAEGYQHVTGKAYK